jgi:hypothetical protein
MIELLAYVVLFLVIMPALIMGVGKLIFRYTAGTPRAGGHLSQGRVSRYRMLRAAHRDA